MERYKNLGGTSGIAKYLIEQESITVQFIDGSIYMYNYQSAGSSNIEVMKKLAEKGQGLNSFINRIVRKKYEKKIR